jgi:hypothetical protein
MVRGIANSKRFGDLILLLRYFFKLKVSTIIPNPLKIKIMREKKKICPIDSIF